MANNKLIKSVVMCPDCGTTIPILRHQKLKPFNIEVVYCHKCKRYVDGVDIQDRKNAIYNLQHIDEDKNISGLQQKVFDHLKTKDKVKTKVYRYE